MVVYDNEFKVDLSKLTENQLLERRKKFVDGLYDGDKGSRDNVEKESLIQLVDQELDKRNRKKSTKISLAALVISIISLAVSFVSLFLKLR